MSFQTSRCFQRNILLNIFRTLKIYVIKTQSLYRKKYILLLFCRNTQITPEIKRCSSYPGSAKLFPIPKRELDDFKGYMTLPRNKKFKMYKHPPEVNRQLGPLQKNVEKIEKEIRTRMGWCSQEKN